MSEFTKFWIKVTIVVSIITSFITYLALIHEIRKDNEDPFRAQGSEYTYWIAFEGYAENLRLMATMKEKCGHLFTPEQLVGCTDLPPLWQDTSNLDHLTMVSSSLGVWLAEVTPAVDAECEDETPCRQWLEEREQKARESPLNITFEDVDTLP